MRSFSLAASAVRTALSGPQSRSTIITTASKRTFSSLPQLRPSILPLAHGTVFRPANKALSRVSLTPSAPAGATGPVAMDLVPKTAITAHPALASVQIRCGPRPTMARSSRLIRKRRHGFLSRLRTRNGRRTLQRRKDKKRSVLSM
ncbi:hypothetical protein DL771_006878 [Monosporascus sp. 5C6A]|nr:hypothetical protein DL771_006878 [Monosporascus sp. 5C6A]